jgi:4-amino-4-deoxy-L-arabinose transferase-like glycosyltransferase
VNSDQKNTDAPNRPQITDHRALVTRAVLLFAGCLIFHVLGTWTLPLIDRDEPRFAEASREMMQRANYVVPYFNDQLRLDKPPLAYWAQVASYRIFGESDFSARFPSAIAAALIALVIFAWGCRIGPASVSWSAAIMFTLSLQTFLHAKAAVADMWLVLFMTVAYWSGYELLRSRTSNAQGATFNIQRRWWWIFYLSLAFGFLAKGPIAWLPLLTLGVIIILEPDWQLARHLQVLRGILLMLAITASWGIPALIQTHGQFLAIGIGRHVISRSLATMEGHGASSFGMYLLLLPFYFVTIFISFFPWSIKLPWLIRQLWTHRKAGLADPGYTGSRLDKYLVVGIATVFVIFTLVATKLPHYTLPAFPLLALLLARYWQGVSAIRNHGPSFRAVATASACLWVAIALTIPPLIARFFPAYELFQQSRAHLQPNMQFASVEFEEPSVVWYFRSRVQGFLKRLNRKNAIDFMSAPGPRFLIVPTSLVQTLFPNHPQTWTSFPARGFNIAKGKQVDLTLVLKQE